MDNKPNQDILAQYQALGEGCGVHRFTQRTILELTGADRTKFLNNFCTADIKRLSSGQGTEAFVTNVQGKTIGYLYVLLAANRILLENAADQAAALMPHWEKYILLDDAELHDLSETHASLLVAGTQAESLLKGIIETDLPENLYDNLEFTHNGSDLLLSRIGMTGPESFLLVGEHSVIENLEQQLTTSGATRCEWEAVEMHRLEAGSPQYGSEVTDANLPQELGRDVQAISFTKGCYLGQETVARIDALGHVNRYLRTVKFAGDTLPDTAWEHAHEGKTVLKVTSTAYSPRLEAPLALAFMRRGHESIGAALETELGTAEVIEPPAGN